MGPITRPLSLRDRVMIPFNYWRGKNFVAELTEPGLRDLAARTAEKLSGLDCDCVLALDGLTIAYLKTELPIYYFWDCTFEGNLEYPWFAKLAPVCLAAGHVMERNAVRNAAMSFYSSQWAVESATRTYGAEPARTKIVPLAANIDCDRTPEDIERLIAGRSTETVQLLFLGIDWLRKGGDLALDVARNLNARGTPTVLHLVGCAPPPGVDLPDFVRQHGFLDKGKPDELAQLQTLIGSAHFLIVPSLAEAFGAVFAEASSFGTPSLARRVGGINSVVTDGLNGYLFDRHASAVVYCDTIERLWNDPEQYRDLALSSFQLFNERLTWTYSAGKLLGYITEDLRNSGAGSRSRSPRS